MELTCDEFARKQFESALDLLKKCEIDTPEFELGFSTILTYKSYITDKKWRDKETKPIIVPQGTVLI